MAQVGQTGSGSTPTSRGASRGSIHGRDKSASPELSLAQLFPSKAMPGVGKKSRKGRTKHGKVGLHGRRHSALPIEAKRDPFRHKDQAAHQG